MSRKSPTYDEMTGKQRLEGVTMRVQHEVKFRLRAIDEETWDRDSKTPIEVYDDPEALDVGMVRLTVGKKRVVVDGRELERALKYVRKWSEKKQ